MKKFLSLACLGGSLLSARADSVVVFNEIMYHPPTNEAVGEWVELHNLMAVDVELSGWSLAKGAQFVFPEGTIIGGGGYLVVAISPSNLVATLGLTNVLGPFTGRLANGGDTLELRNNNGRLMDAVTYGAEGDWPVAPDGAGTSLAKWDENAASSEAGSWVASSQVGGTPGSSNRPRPTTTTTARTLLPIGQIWKFSQSGADLGSTWRTTNYNDSAWPAGPALLADETCGCLPEPIGTPLTVGADRITFYFRTTFQFTGSVAGAVLSSRHVIDDGLVVYLNGTEVWRLGMATGAVASTTLANRGVGDAAYEGPFTIPATSLVTGTNLLAVEVHQNATNSTDVVFGLQLDQLLTVTNIPSQNTVLSLPLALNEISAVTNAEFWLELLNYGAESIALDGFVLARFGTTNREALLPAQTLPAGGYLLLDRATLGFGADPGDRVVLYTPGHSNVVDALVAKRFPRARWPEGTGPWLAPIQVTPGAPNRIELHPEIVINEIMYQPRDLPAIPAAYFTNRLLAMTNVWRYNPSGADLGTAWSGPDYDDSAWPSGRALFYTNINTLPAPKGTTLALSNTAQKAITTYYFRAPVVFTNPSIDLQLTLDLIVDDGAIFYLNGLEVYRYGMPTGAVTYLTRASTNIGVPTNAGPITLPVENLVAGTNWFAVEVHQYLPPPGSKDVAFGAEWVVSGLASPALPARSSPESWLELLNRATNAVDLTGWRLDDGIQFTFPPGTSLAPGAFLVVAKEPDLVRSNHPGVTVLGPFTNKLSKSSDRLVLRDAAGNPANQLRYFSGRPWPVAAAGGGSSLELRDPRADNSKPEAWAASDERSSSSWQTITYRGFAAAEPAASPSLWKEFVLGLLGEGEIWLDDVSVLETPTGVRRQLIQNGNFEAGLSAWRVLGTHRWSEVIIDPANPANHVLRVVTSGDTEHMHNHVETTLANGAAITNGTDYEISFRAKWIAGCNRLNTRLYFNRLARTFDLAVPSFAGTPGAPNSRARGNLGPTFGSFRHAPVAPAATEPVTVSVVAQDPDGVSTAVLRWSANGGAWNQTNLTIQSGGLLLGAIPPYPAATLVQFYVESTDGLGAKSTYPPAGTNSRALYKVKDGSVLPARLHTLRLLMPPGDATYLHDPTNVMSNDRLGCTVIYDDSEAFYDARLHLQGSERGRNNSTRVGFTVQLPADHLFRGVHDGFTVDRSGGYSGKGGRQDEILVKHVITKAGGLPGMYDDLVQCYAPRSSEDSAGLLILAKYGPVFLDSQYQNGGDGEMYKLELIYSPTTTVTGDPQAPKLPQPDVVAGTDITDLGSDPEAYRWIFLKENHVARDNYAPIVTLAKAFSLTGTALDTRLRQLMDVDEWMRAVAFLSLIGADDMYTYGNSHNLLIYFRPEDQKAMAFLWDMDYQYVAAVTKAFPGNGSANTYKIITTLPDNYRRYYNHLYELSGITGDSAYMGQWAARYAGLLGQSWTAGVDYLAQRAAYVRGTMPLTTPFAIANNGGNNFATSNNSLVLSGTAPLQVKDLEVNGLRRPVTWTSLTNWTLTLPLPAFTNLLVVQGLDNHGNRLTNATDGILVTNLGVPALRPVLINEWMADNAGPGGLPDSADGRFKDWFELYNPNDAPVNLSGYYLTDTLSQPAKWAIPSNTLVAPHGFQLVWADNQTNLNGTAGSRDLHANFQLSTGGEAIGLYSPDGTLQHAVVFGPQFQNVSQGLFPDGATNALHLMTNWTPRAANRLGLPPEPAIGPVLLLPDHTLTFSVPALPDRAYRIDYKEYLEARFWTPLTISRPINGLITLTATPADRPQRFYRVVLLP